MAYTYFSKKQSNKGNTTRHLQRNKGNATTHPQPQSIPSQFRGGIGNAE